LIGQASFLESFADDHDGDEVTDFVASDHSIAYYRRAIEDPATSIWLVEEKAGSPVGYAMLATASLPGSVPARDVELKRLYVLSRWHGQAQGAALYNAAEAEARARGAERLLLSVYVANLRAQRFYAQRGFEPIGRWIFAGFRDSEDFILAKQL